jgi:hypothetical protein
MAQAVSRQSLTAEARIRVWINPLGIYGEQSSTERGFSPSSSVFPVNMSFRRRSPNSYYLGDVYVRQWQQFRDVASPHNNK